MNIISNAKCIESHVDIICIQFSERERIKIKIGLLFAKVFRRVNICAFRKRSKSTLIVSKSQHFVGIYSCVFELQLQLFSFWTIIPCTCLYNMYQWNSGSASNSIRCGYYVRLSLEQHIYIMVYILAFHSFGGPISCVFFFFFVVVFMSIAHGTNLLVNRKMTESRTHNRTNLAFG